MTYDRWIKDILKFYRIVAIIGLSKSQNKDSYKVGKYLQDNGFKIIPVNPFADKILREKSYKSLLKIPLKLQKTIEIIDIFRPSNEVPDIVKDVIKLKEIHGLPYVIWMQLNIINDKAAETAKEAGFKVVMNRCMKIEHLKLKQKRI